MLGGGVDIEGLGLVWRFLVLVYMRITKSNNGGCTHARLWGKCFWDHLPNSLPFLQTAKYNPPSSFPVVVSAIIRR